MDAVVHCAYDLRARDRAEIERINLGGTEKLIRAVGDIPIVFISSMSAYAGTQQIYGRTKLACEDLVAAHGGTSLRLGLVHGGDDGGMIGALRKVAALPLVPMLHPDSYQYAVHAEDMAHCVLATVEQPPPHRVLGVADPRRVPFSEIIRTLRAAATSKSLRPVPVTSTCSTAHCARPRRSASGSGSAPTRCSGSCIPHPTSHTSSTGQSGASHCGISVKRPRTGKAAAPKRVDRGFVVTDLGRRAELAD